jgi:hypothetical protein
VKSIELLVSTLKYILAQWFAIVILNPFR